MNLLDESSHQKLADLLPNDLVLLLVEAAQALLHWFGAGYDLQGVLGDFPWYARQLEGLHANISPFVWRKSTSTASYLGSRSALIVSALPSKLLGSSRIFLVPSTGSKLPAWRFGLGALAARTSSFEASSVVFSIASPYSTHSMSHS